MRLIYYPIAIFLAVLVISLSIDASRLTRIASAQSNLEHATDLAWKSILENVTFSLYSGASKTKAQVSDLFEEAARRQTLAEQCAIVFAFAGIIFLIARSTRSQSTSGSLELALVSDLLGIGAICLVVGLIAPVLSLKAYTTLPVVGEVILRYEVKSVITAIGTLAKSQNYFAASLIVVFSVLTPLIKIVIAIAVVQRRWPSWHIHGLEFAKAIGKWSMADVFVVAVLVVYFSASGDKFSEAKVGLGLYYFAAYCLLSQYATQALMRVFKDDLAAT